MVEAKEWARTDTVPAWELPTKRRWELRYDGQVVVGPIAAWVRETLQNAYSTRYLGRQTAGLYVQGEERADARVGDEMELDGERWVVLEVAGQVARCRRVAGADEEEAVLDTTGAVDESGALGAESDGDIELPMADVRLLVCANGQQREDEKAARALAVGDRVRVYWTYERAWYGGEVLECGVDVHGGEGCRIRYDDGVAHARPCTGMAI